MLRILSRKPTPCRPRFLLAPLHSTATRTADRPNKSFLTNYDAKAVEKGWYEWWEREGFFKPARSSSANSTDNDKNFTMITPPPNVTGSLHIGHALTLSIEDAMARYRRMNGFNVEWIPGTDHAGIGTQSVVEKMLMKERQLTRHDMGREEFVNEIWKWRQKYGDRILDQMRRMGASVNWENVFFTMDKPRCEAVQNAFIQLYKDGLVYRDTRLVNWCCALETVISDIEVDYKEIEGRTILPVPGRPDGVEFGVLHQFAYPVANPDPNGVKELIVSTTRIETMLGDCAVAIHPDDGRYKALHGKKLIHPILKKEIPVICDSDLVDMAFGTGAVKITPAHDPNDYACARRHNLPITSIFDKKGRLNEFGGVPEWIGLDRFDLRDIVVEKLKEIGSYQGKDEKHAMRVAVCSRSGDVIEPLLQPQWYVRCGELAQTARQQVEDGAMTIHPSSHTQDWYRWMDNIQDWCISRQLWWGHEIPAYQIKTPNVSEGMPDDHECKALFAQRNGLDLWVVAKDEISAKEEATKLLQKRGLDKDTPFQLIKDEDVLDTWFSSGLLPLSALGWTGQRNECAPAKYPLQLMETGYDILFFWVARMAMLANYFAKQPPFENIYLHAMVRDAQGRKMSKSLGNVIDPLHVIEGVSLETMKENVKNSNLPPKEIKTSVKNLEKEYPKGIPPCGTDALRLALIAYTQQSRQINLDISNVIQISHFCNKIWNMFKFGFGRFEAAGFTAPSLSLSQNPQNLSLVNRFILSRMADTIAKCHDGFESYRLHEAADAARRFILEDVCDVYVEFSKAALNNPELPESEKTSTLNILYTCMDVSLKLMHPFMPFVTEELWQELGKRIPIQGSAPSIMIEKYPSMKHTSHLYDEEIERHFRVVLSIIHASRSLRQGHQISVTKELPFSIICSNPKLLEPLRMYLDNVKSFIKASELHILSEPESISTQDYTIRAINEDLKILVPSEQIVRAQLERATASGADLKTIIDQKQKQLEKKLAKVERDMVKLRDRMSKPGYEDSVPEQVKEKNRQRQRAMELEIETFKNDIRLLRSIL